MNSLRLRAPLVPKAFNVGLTHKGTPSHSCAPVGVYVPESSTANNKHISNNFVVSSSAKKEVYLKTLHKGNVFSNKTGFRIGTPIVVRQTRSYSSYVPEYYAKGGKLIKSHYGGDNPIEFLKPQPETDDQVEAYDQRQFAYLVNSTMRFGITAATQSLLIKFLSNLSANKRVLAVSQIEVDISKVAVGRTITITWRGKPVI
ncbi:ubiquinol-cytochrome c reductase iron-sulfur subunit [Acrasis kona]|uniref:Ubiquinol-cytochrome c reductase iron-sulfur subunit n=1 Tax=Acrasis kona TaxID=1008807 RepID=A0AAW2ZFR8_9EUKA